jgi:signal transduction histidine kinase
VRQRGPVAAPVGRPVGSRDATTVRPARPLARLLPWLALGLYGALTSVGLLLQGRAGIPEDPMIGLGGLAVLSAAVLVWSAVGSLLAARRPSHPIGWLLGGTALVWAIQQCSFGYGAFGLAAHPGSLPAALPVALLHRTMEPLTLLGAALVFLLFPDGRLPSARWRLVAWTGVAAAAVEVLLWIVAPDAIAALGTRNPIQAGPTLHRILTPLFVVAFLGLFVVLVAAVVSLLLRWRRARGEARQQLKWFGYATALVPVGFGMLFFGPSDTTDRIGTALVVMATVAMPVAVAVAIFKYRLYAIDLVIHKTVLIAVLGAFITGVYVAVVVGLGRVLGATGGSNLGLSILATALVAVGFQPARERVKRLADRLVYGKRATPYEVVSRFAAAMATTYAAGDLLQGMVRVLAEGTGATSAGVWLRVGEHLHQAASWPPPAGPDHPAAARLAGEELPVLAGVSRAAPVRHRGELLGALTLTKPPGEPLTPTEEVLLVDLAAQAGLALRNVRLVEELRASRQRIVTAQDQERRRLERDIHDGAQQRLVSIALALRMAQQRLGSAADPALAEGLGRTAKQLDLALAELRELARGIHPAILTEAGLGAALAALAERAAVPARVVAAPQGRLPAAVESTAYFVVCEALANVAKHARASRATITAHQAGGRLRVEVADDGVGGTDPARGSGLRGLADRVAALDGRLQVDSPPGQGTRVVAELPCG